MLLQYLVRNSTVLGIASGESTSYVSPTPLVEVHFMHSLRLLFLKATGDRSGGHRKSSKYLKQKMSCLFCTPTGGIFANRSSVNIGVGNYFFGNSANVGGEEDEKYRVKCSRRGRGV